MREKSLGAQEVGLSLEGRGSRVSSMRSAECVCWARWLRLLLGWAVAGLGGGLFSGVLVSLSLGYER